MSSLINYCTTTKKSAVQRGENISKKNGKMSSNFKEIIRKLYFLVWWKAHQRATHATPPPLREPLPHILHVLDGKVRAGCARFTRENHSRGRGGEGRMICETVPFVNGSSDQLQTQNQDSQYYSAPLLFGQDMPISYWWILASFDEIIWWREAIKWSRIQWPALSRLHCILHATPL